VSPSGKATVFDTVIRRFDPSHPSHLPECTYCVFLSLSALKFVDFKGILKQKKLLEESIDKHTLGGGESEIFDEYPIGMQIAQKAAYHRRSGTECKLGFDGFLIAYILWLAPELTQFNKRSRIVTPASCGIAPSCLHYNRYSEPHYHFPCT
jgi:hypothetical protein